MNQDTLTVFPLLHNLAYSFSESVVAVLRTIYHRHINACDVSCFRVAVS